MGFDEENTASNRFDRVAASAVLTAPEYHPICASG